MKLSFLLVIFCGAAFSSDIHTEFANIEIQNTDFGKPPLEAAISYSLLSLANFRADAEVVIVGNAFNTNQLRMPLSGIFTILNLFSISTDWRAEISWETWNDTVKSCNDIRATYADVKNKIHERDFKLINGVNRLEIAPINREISAKIECIQYIFDEMLYRFIGSNIGEYSGLHEKYNNLIDNLTNHYEQWRDVEMATTTKKRALVGTFNLSAKYLLKIGNTIQAMKNASTDLYTLRGVARLYKAVQLDIVTAFKINADSFNTLGGLLDQIDDYFAYNEPEIITTHCSLIEEYFEMIENLQEVAGQDLIDFGENMHDAEEYLFDAEGNLIDAEGNLIDADQHVSMIGKQKPWLDRMRSYHQDITDSFKRVLYVIGDIEPRVKYNDYPKISSAPRSHPIEIQYDNVSLTSNFNQLPSLRSILFIVLSTWSNIVKNITSNEHYNTIQYKLRMPAMQAIVKMFFNIVDANVVAPEKASLTIMSNCESIIRVDEMIARYSFQLSQSIDDANTNKLQAAINQAIEIIRTNMDEIFYAIIASFPDHILVTLFSQYNELTNHTLRMIEIFQSAMIQMSDENKSFVRALLPTVEITNTIGLKIRQIILHTNVTLFPAVYLYMVFQLDIITRFKAAVDALDVFMGCLAEMDQNVALNFNITYRIIMRLLPNEIAQFSNDLDSSITMFQEMCSQGASVPDVSSRINWLDCLDQRHEGIALGYHPLFIQLKTFLPAPRSDVLKLKYDSVLRDLDYMSIIYDDKMKALKNINTNNDENANMFQLLQEIYDMGNNP